MLEFAATSGRRILAIIGMLIVLTIISYFSFPNMLAFPILFGLGFIISICLVEWVRSNASLLNRIDIPNERSSHLTPTPRGGGIGIVATVLVLWLISTNVLSILSDIPSRTVYGFSIAAVVAAIIGWIDDRYSLRALFRLALYILVCLSFTIAIGLFHTIELPVLPRVQFSESIALVLTVLWLVGFLNIFNFMDGIDGLAGSEAFVASTFWLFLLLVEGQSGLAMLAGLLAAASLGFLFHNMPPARIFMGDVGSAFLGFALAALSVTAYVLIGNSRLPVVGALFVAPFILDGSLTILQRVLRGENVFQAHRSHLYQRLVVAGKSHADVTNEYRWMMFLGGVCGITYYVGSAEVMCAALLVPVIIFSVYSWRANRHIQLIVDVQ